MERSLKKLLAVPVNTGKLGKAKVEFSFAVSEPWQKSLNVTTCLVHISEG